MVTDTEAGRLIAFARAAGLRLPDESPDVMRLAWSVVLADVPPADAEAALASLVGRTPFIDPPAIKTEVKRVRADRLARCPLPAPNADPADAVAYATELRALRDAVAAGRFKPEHRAAYEAGGVSITGTHAALAVTGTPDPAEVEEGKRALARLGVTPKETP